MTISKETTYITEPLRADGYPDYIAALNQRCSRGVTPEKQRRRAILEGDGWPGRIIERDPQRVF